MSETHTTQKIDLDALEAALAKSTPGEWYAERNSRFAYLRVGRHGIGDFCGSLFVAGGDNDTQLSFDNANAAALAHNAFPALIAELRELRSYRAEVEAIMPTMQMLLDFYDDARAEAAVTIPPARKARP